MAKKHKSSKHVVRHKQAKKHHVEHVKHIQNPVVQRMDEEKAFNLLAKYKIPLAPHAFAKNEKELVMAIKKIGLPCHMKASGPTVIHRTEIGGVQIAHNTEEALSNFKRLMKLHGTEKILIQKSMAGEEMIIGLKSDPTFGAVVSAGLGGIYVEVLKDVTFRICPITVSDAESMINELKGVEILKGARTGRAVNLNAIYDVLVKLSKIGNKENISELDINPLFCDEKGCHAVDARIINK